MNRIWIQISSGKGPEECERAVYLFYNAFEKLYNKIKILDISLGRYQNTYKSILISLEVDNLIDKIKEYEGTIKWISQSPFRKNHKRKNWFIKFEIFEEIKENLFNLSDVKIKVTKASGAGGQHVNKTNSAIQLTHIPTGISLKVKEERSQIMNKKLAFARLNSILKLKNTLKMDNIKKEFWLSHNNLERGKAIKTFKNKIIL